MLGPRFPSSVVCLEKSLDSSATVGRGVSVCRGLLPTGWEQTCTHAFVCIY